MKRSNERNLTSEKKKNLNFELGWVLKAAIRPGCTDVNWAWLPQELLSFALECRRQQLQSFLADHHLKEWARGFWQHSQSRLLSFIQV